MVDPQNNFEVDPNRAASVIGSIISTIGGFDDPAASAPLTGPGTTSITSPVPTGVPSDSFVDPSQGAPVNSPFGGARGHPGIDLGLPNGSTVLAAMSGKVTHQANDDPGGYGEWVEITAPNGVVTRYGHLSAASVEVGSEVQAGQVIGSSGGIKGGPTSGNSEGPHLHFEVRVNGQAVDPAPFLAGSHPIVGDKSGQATPEVAAQVTQAQLTGAAVGNIVSVLSGNEPTNRAGQQQSSTAQQGDQPGAAGGTTGNFATDVLEGIGAPASAENIRLMNAWARAEGMGANTFNPLATTEGAPGAVSINDAGVRRYASYADGVQATIRTLLNGNFSNIIAALRAGKDALSVARAIREGSTVNGHHVEWGTGALVEQILAGG